MPTTANTDQIIYTVKRRLNVAERENGIYLEVSDFKVDDDWLYIVVVPSRPGVRASDHAKLMTTIERELLADGHGKVLLVPALED